MSKKDKKAIALNDIKITAKPFEIIEATLSDGYCNYKYEVKEGTGIGDIHKVDGSGLYEDDMAKVFAKLNVHLAAIDDVFKNSGIEESTIAKLRANQLTFNYSVTAIKIQGEEENLSVIISGTKSVSTSNGHMSLKTPKILMDKMSGYDWHKDLKESVAKICEEVELYKAGKCTAPSKEEQTDPNQLTIESMEEEGEEEFEKGKV